jgi:pyruvate ferredoxin oxidoreductase gamma subunit
MKQIKMYGLGGQGVVTAAKVFCEAVAIHEDGHAQAIPAYGHERRGAPVYSDVIVSQDPIKIKGFVYSPDYVIIFDDPVMDKGIDVMAGKRITAWWRLILTTARVVASVPRSAPSTR